MDIDSAPLRTELKICDRKVNDLRLSMQASAAQWKDSRETVEAVR